MVYRTTSTAPQPHLNQSDHTNHEHTLIGNATPSLRDPSQAPVFPAYIERHTVHAGQRSNVSKPPPQKLRAFLSQQQQTQQKR